MYTDANDPKNTDILFDPVHLHRERMRAIHPPLATASSLSVLVGFFANKVAGTGARAYQNNSRGNVCIRLPCERKTNGVGE